MEGKEKWSMNMFINMIINVIMKNKTAAKKAQLGREWARGGHVRFLAETAQ